MRTRAWAVVAALVAVLAAGRILAEQADVAQTEGADPGPARKEHAGKAMFREGPMDMELLPRLIAEEKAAERLGLTPEQITSIRDGIKPLRARLGTLEAELRKAGTEQARLMTAADIDEAAVMAAVEKTGGIRTELAKLRVAQLLAIRKVLTPAQLEKARSVARQRADKWRERKAAAGHRMDERPEKPAGPPKPERPAPAGR